MPEYNIRGISVDFPFEAYACQLKYMEKVIQSLQKGHNALLESPTGTGKTLCLLCASLAWWRATTVPLLKVNETDLAYREKPRIIYASRTHSQLQQVIKELKNTSYKDIRLAVLGSREQMCIHPKVSTMKGHVQNHACRTMVQGRQCGFHHRVQGLMSSLTGPQTMDIEDLVTLGHKEHACPFYISRELQGSADLICVPYNYLVDPNNRRSLNIKWQNDILIFDEAHNLDSICSDSASFELSSTQVGACCNEIQHCITKLSTEGRMPSEDAPQLSDLLQMKVMLLDLEKTIDRIQLTKASNMKDDLCANLPGEKLLEIFAEIKITDESIVVFLEMADKCVTLLQEGNQTSPTLGFLTTCLRKVFRGEVRMSDFRLHVREEKLKKQRKQGAQTLGAKPGKMLCFWCFNPGLGMIDLKNLGVRSMILTSGTLAPLDSFAFEMRVPFWVTLENTHVITSRQVWVGVLHKGPAGQTLNSSYKYRNSQAYLTDLGNTVVQVCRMVPDGVLLFFPSYGMMTSCKEAWEKPVNADGKSYPSVMERITAIKHIVLEPTSSAECPTAMADYTAKLEDPAKSGAIFLAVSEGLDFADKAGRAVMVVGLPFPPQFDPKVVLKRQYLDLSKTNGKQQLTGQTWYTQQALRAVNQAIGRVIRHRNDYGAIILCDERFAFGQNRTGLSKWIQPQMQSFEKYGDAVKSLSQFFRTVAQEPFAQQASVKKKAVVPVATDQPLSPSHYSGEGGAPPAVSQRKREHREIGVEAPAQAKRTLLSLKSSLRNLPKDSFSPYETQKTAARTSSTTQPEQAAEQLVKRFDFHSQSQASSTQQSRNPPPPGSSAREKPSIKPVSSVTDIKSKYSTNRPKDMQAFIQVFLKQVQSATSPSDFNTFKAKLKGYKDQSVSLSELISFINDMFHGQDPVHQTLKREFLRFLPKDAHAQYMRDVGISSQPSSSPHPDSGAATSGKSCLNCHKIRNLLAAECGHACCKECWEEIVFIHGMCPKCSTVVKSVDQLVKS